MSEQGLKSHRMLLSIVMFAIVIGGIGYGVYLLRNPGPFKGVVRHDFGIIPIEGLKGSAEHTFELVNTSDETIYIEHVKPSCGCTAVEVSERYVESGATVAITARLTLNRSGVKDSQLRMILPDHGTQTLYVKGTGRRNNPLASIQDTVSIEPNGNATIRLSAEVYEAFESPAPPAATVPEGFTVDIGTWVKKGARDSSKRTPDRYNMNVTVRHRGEAIPEGGALLLTMPDEQGKPVSIELPIVDRTDEQDQGRVFMPAGAQSD